MALKAIRKERRQELLTREQIVEAAITVLDTMGEAGLTFRTLSERLATGPGALYGHIENKGDLVTAACDSIVAGVTEQLPSAKTPQANIRALALGMFDAIDEHPWVGSALMRAQLHSPMVRILEHVGQQVRAMGVTEQQQWAAVAALMNYILGVGGQNAANGYHAKERGIDRDDFLKAVSDAWLLLDRRQYPFTHSVAQQLAAHDDRKDFLSGIDFIIAGIEIAKKP